MARPKTPNPLAIALGGALRRARVAKDLSSRELAKAAGLNDSFYRLIESGRNHPSVAKALALHSAFGGDLSFEALTFFISTISASSMLISTELRIHSCPGVRSIAES